MGCLSVVVGPHLPFPKRAGGGPRRAAPRPRRVRAAERGLASVSTASPLLFLTTFLTVCMGSISSTGMHAFRDGRAGKKVEEGGEGRRVWGEGGTGLPAGARERGKRAATAPSLTVPLLLVFPVAMRGAASRSSSWYTLAGRGQDGTDGARRGGERQGEAGWGGAGEASDAVWRATVVCSLILSGDTGDARATASVISAEAPSQRLRKGRDRLSDTPREWATPASPRHS